VAHLSGESGGLFQPVQARSFFTARMFELRPRREAWMSNDAQVKLVAEMLVSAISDAIREASGDARRQANLSGASVGATDGSKSGLASRAEAQKLKLTVGRPPDSIPAHLRSLAGSGYLSAKAACKYMGCHLETLYRLIAEEGLPAQKRGRRWRIDPLKFADWLESRGFAPAPTSANSAKSAASRRERSKRSNG